jgi:large subunit ribosomal protein L4
MASIDIKNKEGKSVGKHELSEALEKATASSTTMHRTVVAEEANRRQGTQSTLTRAEVRGGGRKPYRQKKTGRARQGTIRAPHYAHGGVAFAPKPRDYDKKVNRKERRAAILTALADHLTAGTVNLVDAISFSEPKTKEAVGLLRAFGLENERRILIVLPEHDPIVLKSFRNLGNVVIRTAPALANGAAGEGEDEGEAVKSAGFSARDLMVARHVVIVKDALARIEEVWTK